MNHIGSCRKMVFWGDGCDTPQSLIWRNAGRAHFAHATVIPFEKET